MIRIEFTPEEIENLDYERYYHPSPKVQKRMEALYLKSRKVPHKDILELCRISGATLIRYLRIYQSGGVEALKQFNYKGKPSELNRYRGTLESYFKEHPPKSVPEAMATIEKLTGVKRSPTQIRQFLKKLGPKRRKTGAVPGKAVDQDKIKEQETFEKEELRPRLDETKKGKRVLFFADAAHFVHASFLGFVWRFVRVFISSPSGRKRFNVLGALNAVTKEVVTVTNETYINARCVCRLMLRLAVSSGGLPLTPVLDNARYQKCALVQDCAKILNVELLYIPSYSPNLNLIERFWKFVKAECLYSEYYESFEEFQKAIETCIREARGEHKEKLDSLLSWNFQPFKV